MKEMDKEKTIRIRCIWIISIVSFFTFIYVTGGIGALGVVGGIIGFFLALMFVGFVWGAITGK